MPPFIFESAFSIRMSLVSAFLPEMTQQIHSLRASGVISSQSVSALGEERMALRRSSGNGWTVPVATRVMDVWYQIFVIGSAGRRLSRTFSGSVEPENFSTLILRPVLLNGIPRKILRVLPTERNSKTPKTCLGVQLFLAPRVGVEPTTNSLTASCSTIELPRNVGVF